VGEDDTSDADSQLELAQAQKFKFGYSPDRRLNIEAIQLTPVLLEDDDFYFHLLSGELFPGSNPIADTTPPFGLYPINLNHFPHPCRRNPFAAYALQQPRRALWCRLESAWDRRVHVLPLTSRT